MTLWLEPEQLERVLRHDDSEEGGALVRIEFLVTDQDPADPKTADPVGG
jgi:hypothetical protein